jgi:hypothetical protein
MQNQVFSEYINETFGKDAFRGDCSFLTISGKKKLMHF